VDQVDHGDHDPPWWTRSVQDHFGPRYDISLMHILALPLLSYLAPTSYTPSTPGPLPPSALSHPGLSPSSPSLRLFDFNHIVFIASPPLGNLILSLLLLVFLRPFFTRSVSLWFLFTITYPSCLPAVCLSICLATILIVPVLPCPLLVLP